MAMTHLGMQAGTMKLQDEFLELLHGLGKLYIVVSLAIPSRQCGGEEGDSNRPTLSNT